MTMSNLKEAFAFAETLEEREAIVKQLAVQGSNDWIYYNGLILLQKLHDEISLAKDNTQPREPTSRESELMQAMRDFLAKHKDDDIEELEIRFNILIYPISADSSSEFLRRKLGIQDLARLQQQQQRQEPDSTPTPTQHRFVSAKKTRLDASFIEPRRLLGNVIQSPRDYDKVNLLTALPELKKMDIGKLSPKERQNLAFILTMYPVTSCYTDFVVQALSGYIHENVNLENLTLEQMDKLRSVDAKLNDNKDFMQEYVKKLRPYRHAHNPPRSGAWDDFQGILEEYVNVVWEFVKSMDSSIFTPLKWILLFYKLKIKTARQEYDDIQLFREYYKFKYEANGLTYAHIQMDGLQAPTTTDHNEVVRTFLTGALKLNKNIPLDDLKNKDVSLKHLIAEIMLSYKLDQDVSKWQKELEFCTFDQLLTKTELEFEPATVYVDKQLLPSDTVSLQLRIKNVPSLTIRVFQIDLFQYWRLHPELDSITVDDINLDGLCPSWESTRDCSHVDQLQTFTENIEFPGDQEPFKGRGAWIVDIMGGRENCRAVITKGHLRHIDETSAAGHSLTVIDENSMPLCKGDVKIWFNGKHYEPENLQPNQIWLPYLPKGEWSNRALLISTADGYCQPIRIDSIEERYNVEADITLHTESLVPNKRSEILIAPRVTIHGIDAPLDVIKGIDVTVTMENAQNIKSMLSFKEVDFSRNNPIKLEITVPPALERITCKLDFSLDYTTNSDSTNSVYQKDILVSMPKEDFGSVYLEAGFNGYRLHVLGKNGESLPKTKVDLRLEHVMVNMSIENTLYTDENGVIELGRLENVSRLTATCGAVEKTWNMLLPYTQAVTPDKIHQVANEPFSVAYASGPNRCCTLFSALNGRYVVKDFSDAIAMDTECVRVSGLPEGRYMMLLTDYTGRARSIECIVNQPVAQEAPIKNWTLGKIMFTENSGLVTQRPLHIKQIDISDDTVAVDLANWSNNSTMALVTSSTFVSTNSAFSILQPSFLRNRFQLPVDSKSPIMTACYFLSGRKLSEELCYILNRSRQEKWVGSTLNKPSLLMYPKKNGETDTKDRETDGGHGFKAKHAAGFCKSMLQRKLGDIHERLLRINEYFDQEHWSDLTFLSHHNPVLCLRPDENGRILINRNDLGEGNILQIAVFGHDMQAISRQFLLSDPVAPKRVDLRQSVPDPTAAYLRSKSIAKLGPVAEANSLALDLSRHEWEVVDNFETVFDLCKLLTSDYVAEELSKFEFLKTWHDMDLEKKLEKHQELPCHELNLWLKYKDPVFFDQHVKPYIKCKLHKTFMDDYLIDENLQKYSSNLHLYRKLDNLELALLAKRDPKVLPVVKKSFKDIYSAPSESEVDNKFDTVLARKALRKEESAHCNVARNNVVPFSNIAPQIAVCPPAPSAAPAPAGALFEFASAQTYSKQQQQQASTAARNFRMAAQSAAAMPEPEVAVRVAADIQEEEDDGMEFGMESPGLGPVDDEEMEERQKKMREAMKKRSKPKTPYELVKPTAEYIETGYYDTMGFDEPVTAFLLDYLATSESSSTFLSGNFIYSTHNLRAILFVLSLLDIPFKANAKYKLESDPESGTAKIVSGSPCLVFHRMLESLPITPVASPSVLIGQGFFLRGESQGQDEEQNLVEWNDMRPLTEYGWHLALSNISPKTRTVEVTLQVPTGSIPTRQTSYCRSRTIKIAAYSTWHEVVGSFYFPQVGDFTHLSVTVSESSKILGQTDPLGLTVKPASVADLESKSVSWSTVASEGSDERVLEYLREADLSKLDLSLLEWRMTNPEFALRLLGTLRELKFYSWSMWQYGLHHHFPVAVRELLQNDAHYLLYKCGSVLETPLVNIVPFDNNNLKILDYYPVINARAHPVGEKREILNKQFKDQYDRFLSYLVRKSTLPGFTDLLTLATYLVTQDRISEARKIYDRLSRFVTGNTDNGQQIQMDYLGAYLQTRVKMEEIQDNAHLIDLEATRQLVTKHINCSSLRWRKMFTSIKDFLDEVEKRQQGGTDATKKDMTDERMQARSVLSEAVLDFGIKDNYVHLTYANVDQVQIRYYKMNVEVMFSNNPFMSGKSLDTNYGWIKPSFEEKHSLAAASSEKQDSTHSQGEDDSDDFDVIGVGKLGVSLAKIKIPAELACSDIMVEVAGGSLVRRKAHFSHKMLVHFVETFGMVRVAEQSTQVPIAGAYVKVYARMKHTGKLNFWKDGYTGLNGVFDYVSVTEGNSLVSSSASMSLKELVSKIEKFSLFIESKTSGAVVEEVFPPEA